MYDPWTWTKVGGWWGWGTGRRGRKGKIWDNCNGMIKKICFKKRNWKKKKNASCFFITQSFFSSSLARLFALVHSSSLDILSWKIALVNCSLARAFSSSSLSCLVISDFQILSWLAPVPALQWLISSILHQKLRHHKHRNTAETWSLMERYPLDDQINHTFHKPDALQHGDALVLIRLEGDPAMLEVPPMASDTSGCLPCRAGARPLP